MSLPEVVLTEYAAEDKAILQEWWEDADVVRFVHALEHQMEASTLGFRVAADRYIARQTLRWMVRDRATDVPLGFVAVQVTGESRSPDLEKVFPPFHGGVNIVVDPVQQRGGLGAATLKALFDVPQLADVVTLSGTVDAENDASLGMLRKLGYKPEGPAENGLFRFTVPGPATAQSDT